METFHEALSPERLEKDTSSIMAAQEVVITEKIDGTNFRIWVGFDLNGNFQLKYGSHHQRIQPGEGSVHCQMADTIQNDDNLKKTLENYLKFFTNNEPESYFMIFGEIYGGKVQRGQKYCKGIRFRVFDMMLSHQGEARLFDYEALRVFCEGVGFKMAPLMYRGKPDIEIFKHLLTEGSYTAEEEGQEAFKPIEGIVVKENPPRKIRPGLSFNQQWNCFKYKNAEFEEIQKAPKEMRDLGKAYEFASQVITQNRLDHVIAQLKESGVELKHHMSDMRFIPKAMVQDVMKEESELFNSYVTEEITEHDLNKAMTKMVADMYQARVYPPLTVPVLDTATASSVE